MCEKGKALKCIIKVRPAGNIPHKNIECFMIHVWRVGCFYERSDQPAIYSTHILSSEVWHHLYFSIIRLLPFYKNCE